MKHPPDADAKGRKRKKKALDGRTLILLLVGGGVVLFACCGCGLGGVFFFGPHLTAPNVVGAWQQEGGLPIRYTFNKDGTGRSTVMGLETQFHYQQFGSEMTLNFTQVGGVKVLVGDPSNRSRYRIERTGDRLRMEQLEGTERDHAGTYRKIG